MKIKSEICFGVIGGDLRQACLADILSSEGYNVIISGLEQCEEVNADIKAESIETVMQTADVIVLPLPVSRDNTCVNAPFSTDTIYLENIASLSKEGQLITGGILSEDFVSRLKKHGASAADYYGREELTILNSIPTAEGALEIILRESKRTIYASTVLISGYGRIGRVLTKMFKGLGADVYVSMRKQSDKAWVLAEGAKPIFIDKIKDFACYFDTVINTVPHVLFDSKLLRAFNPSALFIDLASLPGGIDFDAANKLGIKAISAQSLPGKCAPFTAAEFVKETIFNIMEEQIIL